MTINLDQYTNQIAVTDANANASLVVQPKGTGAIDLASGSSGVNISNGGTVTALTRTAIGSSYTGFPSIAITAPTTAGGVQATATSQLVAANGTVVSGGTGYTLSDVLTVTTSGGSSAITLTVTGVSSGVVTTATANSSALTTIPSGTVSVSGGTGSGATFNLLYVISATFTITAAGSGYVEQPTVTFSGGGGSGAAAYASVGSGTIFRSIGSTSSFYTPSGEVLRLTSTAATNTNYISITGDGSGNTPTISSTNNLRFSSGGGASLIFSTNSGSQTQMQVTNTASAVNYVQATGGATGIAVQISAQGSGTDIPLVLQPKGTGALQAQLTDSTATGGNVRGANAVDWQTSRTLATQIASGTSSVIAGGSGGFTSNSYASILGGLANGVAGFGGGVVSGYNNRASANYSIEVGGYSNTASGEASFIGSGNANTTAGYFNFIGNGYSNSGTASAAVTTQSGTMNATTAVTLSGSNANIKVGQLITGTSIATYPHTYVAAISGTSLTLSQAASGSSTSTLSFFTPHGVVVGGGNNQATGSYSFIGGGGDAGTAANRNVASGDWSFVGAGTRQTASGAYSSISGGLNNTASNIYAVVAGGTGNNSSGYGAGILNGASQISNATLSAVLGGQFATTRSINSNIIFGSGCPIAYNQGISQAAIIVLGKQTTDATPSVLTSDPSVASGTNQVILPNNSAYFFTGEVVSGVTGGGNTKGWSVEGVIKRGANAASTALVGTPTVTSLYADAGASTWALTATADVTNGGLAITFTGQAATTIRVVCQLRTTEMTY